MEIQFGTLKETLGRPTTHQHFTFHPGSVDLAGNGFSSDFHLRDCIGHQRPKVLVRPIDEQYDASWVRARIPRVFGFTPEPSDVEKSLLDVGFVAVPVGADVGFPFLCTDYYGRSGLMFSPHGPNREMQKKIAAAFWSILLQFPDDLADFETKVFHPGAGIWMHFGCRNGKPTYAESAVQD